MTLLRDSENPGSLRRLLAEYRRLRRDQAPNHPDLVMRMSRRSAASCAWSRRAWL